jgi:hypothetical protein
MTQTRNVLLRSVATRNNIDARLNVLVPNLDPKPQGLDSPKKNELLVRIVNTQHMQRNWAGGKLRVPCSALTHRPAPSGRLVVSPAAISNPAKQYMFVYEIG